VQYTTTQQTDGKHTPKHTDNAITTMQNATQGQQILNLNMQPRHILPTQTQSWQATAEQRQQHLTLLHGKHIPTPPCVNPHCGLPVSCCTATAAAVHDAATVPGADRHGQ
jgi:hypothetical protein